MDTIQPQQQGLISKYRPLIGQFLRFAIVGGINTGIDFAILNLLFWVTGIYEGAGVIPLNLISFTAAVVNSYFLNKKWAFKDQTTGQGGKQFSLFLVISIIGALINTGIVWAGTTHVQPLFGLGAELWANVAKLVATGVALIWNFVGYRLIVFKKT